MTAKNLWRMLGLVLIIWSAAAVSGMAAEPPGLHLDLKEALRLAWKANPNLQISRLQSLIAGQEVVRARSGLLPQVKTQVNQTIYDDPLKFKFGGGIPGLPGGASFPQTNKNFWSSQTSVNQLLFDFWGTPSKYMAAIKGHQASLLDTSQTRDNVFLT
ncbi:MAG: TolC family protein, partial [Candidatus Deferrimicrobium sp.]